MSKLIYKRVGSVFIIFSFLGESHLRPGHYTVKNKDYGHECLRCGMKGHISLIKTSECTNPTGEPIYPQDSIGAEANQSPFSFHSESKEGASTDIPNDTEEKGLRDELAMLQELENQLAMINALEEEKQLLENLEMQHLMLDYEQVVPDDMHPPKDSKDFEEDPEVMKTKLIDMNIPEPIATWAVEEAKGEWEKALDKALKAEIEKHWSGVAQAEAKKDALASATKGRPPATPMSSTTTSPAKPDDSMPPPPVPKKARTRKIQTPSVQAEFFFEAESKSHVESIYLIVF